MPMCYIALEKWAGRVENINVGLGEVAGELFDCSLFGDGRGIHSWSPKAPESR